jgi:hypothetical protein
MSAAPMDNAAIEAVVLDWLSRIVIGLNLCPFAARPLRDGRVRVHVSAATTPVDLLTDVQLELARLGDTPASQLETTLIAIPHLLADFLDFNDFLDAVDALLDEYEWTGEVQVASFHPDYQFAGTLPTEPGNYTNRSPLPILHLLREASVEAAVDSHPDPDGIPEANVARLEAMTLAERRALFTFLKPQAPA